MLADFFAGVQETLILIPKKNGKTTILAALALHHLLLTEGAECVIAAASRDQAQILLGQAHGFIRRTPALGERLRVKQREIVRRDGGGRIRVLASDVDTADGVIPTLALVDELHRHRSADLYGVFRDGLGPRQGRMVTISTAGEDELSPLGLARSEALRFPVIERDGAYTRAVSEDGGFAIHEFALHPDEDREDMRVVKRANPAPWQTLEALKRRRESPLTTAAQWARFACGVWMRSDNLWLDDAQGWHAGGAAWTAPDPERPLVIGVDPARTFDTFSLVAFQPDEEGPGGLAWPLAILRPQDEDGGIVPLWRVRGILEDALAEWRVLAVGHDRGSGMDVLAEEMSGEHDVPFVAVSMGPDTWAPLTAELRGAVNRGAIRHPSDPELTAHVLHGEVKDSPAGPRLHGRTRGKVDALIALGIAWRLAFHEQIRGRASVYETKELRVW